MASESPLLGRPIPAPGDVGDPNHISAAKDAQLLEFEGW